MKKPLAFVLFSCIAVKLPAQSGKTELYDLVKKLLYDSTGYENVGDWAVGNPKKFPVQWKAYKIEMSGDTSINFYRLGSMDILLKGKTYMQTNQPVKWNIMLKGARSGYSSFSIISTPSTELQPKYTIDSLFGNKPSTATLLKSCDAKTLSGYYYYPGKNCKERSGIY